VRVPSPHDGREGERGGNLFRKEVVHFWGLFDSQLKLVDELVAVFFLDSLG
jgi:hypothetical protein